MVTALLGNHPVLSRVKGLFSQNAYSESHQSRLAERLLSPGVRLLIAMPSRAYRHGVASLSLPSSCRDRTPCLRRPFIAHRSLHDNRHQPSLVSRDSVFVLSQTSKDQAVARQQGMGSGGWGGAPFPCLPTPSPPPPPSSPTPSPYLYLVSELDMRTVGY